MDHLAHHCVYEERRGWRHQADVLTEVDMLIAGPYGGQRKEGTVHKIICKKM